MTITNPFDLYKDLEKLTKMFTPFNEWYKTYAHIPYVKVELPVWAQTEKTLEQYKELYDEVAKIYNNYMNDPDVTLGMKSDIRRTMELFKKNYETNIQIWLDQTNAINAWYSSFVELTKKLHNSLNNEGDIEYNSKQEAKEDNKQIFKKIIPDEKDYKIYLETMKKLEEFIRNFYSD